MGDCVKSLAEPYTRGLILEISEYCLRGEKKPHFETTLPLSMERKNVQMMTTINILQSLGMCHMLGLHMYFCTEAISSTLQQLQ